MRIPALFMLASVAVFAAPAFAQTSGTNAVPAPPNASATTQNQTVPKNAATFCAQHVGAHPKRDCSFSTLDECRASIRAQGGGRCYRKR